MDTNRHRRSPTLFWKGKRVLITGAAGFTGRHLAASLAGTGASVHGFDRAPHANHRIEAHTGDLLDPDRVRQVLDAVEPGVIFHLAGLIKSRDAARFERINVHGTEVLLRSAARAGTRARTHSRPRIVMTSSSAVYAPGGDSRIAEGHPLEPISAYGRSKLAMEGIAGKYGAEHGIPIVICRTFNLVGPGLTENLALSSFAAQIVRAERGEIDEIRVGNLDAGRDYVDVRDAVEAYRLLAEQGQPGESYNVCSGERVTIRGCLEILLSLADARPRVRRVASKSRPRENPSQVGDPSKIRAQTGWEPRIPLERSLEDLLDSWRSRTDGGG